MVRSLPQLAGRAPKQFPPFLFYPVVGCDKGHYHTYSKQGAGTYDDGSTETAGEGTSKT